MSDQPRRPDDDYRRAFTTGIATELGRRVAAAIVFVIGLLLSAALLLGGVTLLLGLICVLQLALLVMIHRRHGSAGRSHPPAEDDQEDELDTLLVENDALRSQLTKLQKAHKDVLRRDADSRATIEEFRRMIDDLRAEDHEKSQRLELAQRKDDRRQTDAAVILDMLLIGVEEADADGVLRITEPTVLLERLIGTARAALSRHRVDDVGLAMIVEDGASRRVMNSAGIRRTVLEDTSRPLVDVAVDAGRRLYPVRLPQPFANHRLIALFDGEPTTADTDFLD